MDFQEIRRKAKERAARAAATDSPGPAVGPGGEPAAPPRPGPVAAPRAPGKLIEEDGPGPGSKDGPAEGQGAGGVEGGPPGADGSFPKSPRRPPPGSPEALRLEAELANRLAALSPAADARFVTWRPDGGPLPALAAIAPAEDDLAEPWRERSGPPAPLDALEDFFYRPDESAGAAGALVAPASDAVASLAVALDEYLIFKLAGEEFGVEIGRVLEVMRTPPVTEVPRAPPDVLGIISVRGEVITVVDPRARLGLAPGAGGPARRVVVVDDGEGACGLLVDQVAGVVRLPRGALEPCPEAIAAGGGEVFLGIGREQQRLFTVLDARALLGPLRRTPEARPA